MSDIQDAETAQLLSQFSGPVTITPMQAAYPGAEPFADNGLAGFADFDAWNGQSVDAGLPSVANSAVNPDDLFHGQMIDINLDGIQPAEPEQPAVKQQQTFNPIKRGYN